jgi:hypothetical protein
LTTIESLPSQEKQGKLIFRRKKRNALTGDSYKGLGAAKINLSTIATAPEPTELVVDLTSGVFASITIFPQIFGEV